MSQAVVNPAVEYVDGVLGDPACTLPANARSVLLQLALRWNRRSQTSLIGVRRRPGKVDDADARSGLMLRTGLSERAIRYAFKQIAASGYAVPDARPGQTNVWRFPAVDAALAAADGTPAPGAPLHLVHPSIERRGARGAPTPARGAPTPARGAPLPVLKPVVETSALAAVDDAQPLRPNDVLRCPNLPPRRNAWCHATCELCHGMGHVYAEQLGVGT